MFVALRNNSYNHHFSINTRDDVNKMIFLDLYSQPHVHNKYLVFPCCSFSMSIYFARTYYYSNILCILIVSSIVLAPIHVPVY